MRLKRSSRVRVKMNLRFFYLFSTVMSLGMAMIGAMEFPGIMRGIGISLVLIVHGTLFYMFQRRSVPGFLHKSLGLR